MPEPVILFYPGDLAARNMVRILRESHDLKVPILESNDEILYLDSADFKASLIIVPSRHSSKSGKACLTCHSPGNFFKAEAGGRERELGIAPALYLRKALISLKENSLEEYDVSLECTHHGPTGMEIPMMFMEIGSTEQEWDDEDACSVVASVIREILDSSPEKIEVAIGFGGGHYCRKFSKVEEYALGHICPRYQLENLSSEMVKQMIQKTIPKPEHALVEKKGLGRGKERVLELLENTNLEIIMV